MGAYHAFYTDMDLEFSICDDGSEPEVIAYDCVVVQLPKKTRALNPCLPINVAVDNSNADIIVLTNPEVTHTERIFPQMIERLKTPWDYVIAACRQKKTGHWICGSHVQGTDNGRMPFPRGSGFHFCTMFHRSLWELAGGFDEDYRKGQACDDNDWLWRLEDVGVNFIMCDHLVVEHYDLDTKWPHGGLRRNKKLLRKKWGHKWSSQS